MKQSILLLLITFISGWSLFGQSEASFTVEISSDTVLMGNLLQVRFTVEGGQAEDFTPPVFENFDARGPNISTSMSVINGEVSQRASYTFFLQPREPGNFYIEPASIVIDGDALETKPVEVIALPNPDGIIQQPAPMGDSFQFHLNPEELFQMPVPKSEKKKKKRRTYKM